MAVAEHEIYVFNPVVGRVSATGLQRVGAHTAGNKIAQNRFGRDRPVSQLGRPLIHVRRDVGDRIKPRSPEPGHPPGMMTDCYWWKSNGFNFYQISQRAERMAKGRSAIGVVGCKLVWSDRTIPHSN